MAENNHKFDARNVAQKYADCMTDSFVGDSIAVFWYKKGIRTDGLLEDMEKAGYKLASVDGINDDVAVVFEVDD